MDGGVSPFAMNDKEIEALVMARPDMAQAVFHDIVPVGAFAEFARAVIDTECERRKASDSIDQVIELACALEVRRILEEIKKVAVIHPCADMPTPFQSAWQTCCEEIFFRATGEKWNMGEDADRFGRQL